MTRRELIRLGSIASLTWSLPIPLTSFTKYNKMKDSNSFEVIIIGGSYSGLSAAMALGRSLRKVLIIDGGNPCNKQTPYSHNFLTQDGKTPSEISTISKQQVQEYETIKFHYAFAKSGRKTDVGFEVSTDRGESFTSKKIIFATGINDLMPEIKGFSECWGISVIHCPYCHGYEFRDNQTAILANGDRAFHLASLVNNLTPQLTILTNGKADFNKEQLKKLNQHSINIIESEIVEVEHKNGKVQKVIFNDGNNSEFSAVYASLPFRQHSDIPVSLGCELTESGHISIDAFQKTTIEGVYACGDNSSMMRSIATVVYNGNLAGAMVNHELTQEQF